MDEQKHSRQDAKNAKKTKEGKTNAIFHGVGAKRVGVHVRGLMMGGAMNRAVPKSKKAKFLAETQRTQRTQRNLCWGFCDLCVSARESLGWGFTVAGC